MKRVQDEIRFVILIIMIPFCRRLDEGEKVLTEMKKNGLKRVENGLRSL